MRGSKDSGYHNHPPRFVRESFEFRGLAARGESMVLAIPNDLKKLGGRCVEVVILKIDSWRVKNVFKSDRGVSYEGISSYMYNYLIILDLIPGSRLSDTDHKEMLRRS